MYCTSAAIEVKTHTHLRLPTTRCAVLFAAHSPLASLFQTMASDDRQRRRRWLPSNIQQTKQIFSIIQMPQAMGFSTFVPYFSLSSISSLLHFFSVVSFKWAYVRGFVDFNHLSFCDCFFVFGFRCMSNEHAHSIPWFLSYFFLALLNVRITYSVFRMHNSLRS